MKKIRPLAFLFLFALATGCGGKNTPIEPTHTRVETATPVRIIAIVGSLNYGSVPINTTASGVITVRNDGNTLLTVTGMTVPFGAAGGVWQASWSGGSIPARSEQNVTISFTPTEPRSYSGTLTVNGDQTSGLNTQNIVAFGAAPLWSKTGSGDNVFDSPIYIQKMRITGIYNAFSSNFIVKVGGRLILNELLGVGWGHTVYDGTVLTHGGGTVAITNSNGVAWSFTEAR